MFISFRFFCRVWLLCIHVFLFGIATSAYAGQYDGKWSGDIICELTSREYTRTVDLVIEGDNALLRNFQKPDDGNYPEYEGSIALEDGFFTDKGEISFSGSVNFGRGKSGDWSLQGEWAASLIRLTGKNGSADCKGSLFPVNPAVEARLGNVVTVKSESGNKLRFLLFKPPNPVAGVIIFAGGRGYLGLSESGKLLRQKGSFPIGIRENFGDHGLMVAIMDAPFGVKDLRRTYRMSEKHGQDIEAVVWELKNRGVLPVWLIGHSRGTYSAANGAVRLKDLVWGAVLASTVTKARETYESFKTHPKGVLSMELAKVKVPVLILANKTDSCSSTPASNAEVLGQAFTGSAKVAVKVYDGEAEPKPDNCKSDSQHHFYGFQDKVISTIADFIKTNAN